MINLHMLSQIQSNSLSIQLSVCATVPRILTNFFRFTWRCCCARIKLSPFEWPNLVPRQCTGDCLWIHIPHWELCDPPLSSHQTFQHEIEFRQCAFCREPLSSKFACILRKFRSFGKWAWILWCLDVVATSTRRSKSEWTRELCAGTSNSFTRLFLWTRATTQEYLPTDRPHPSIWPFHLSTALGKSFTCPTQRTGVSVDTYVCLRPLDRLIIGQCRPRPWRWWTFQAFHIHDFFRMFLYQFLKKCWTHSQYSRILCSCRSPNSPRNPAQDGWRLHRRR